MANWLSRWCDVPNCNHVVKRIKHTHTQRGLTAKDRRHNLKNAFAVNTKKPFPYERVALVDDVITTGSTLAEIAKQPGIPYPFELSSISLNISIKIGINVEKIAVSEYYS